MLSSSVAAQMAAFQEGLSSVELGLKVGIMIVTCDTLTFPFTLIFFPQLSYANIMSSNVCISTKSHDTINQCITLCVLLAEYICLLLMVFQINSDCFSGQQ
jgi:hypothetical protein